MQTPTPAQLSAFGRHVLTASASVVTTLAVLSILKPADAASATSAIDQISTGVKSIIAGATTLIGLGSGLYAALTASPLWQMLAVAKNPAVQSIVTTPAVADSVPSDKVVSK